MRSAAKKTAQPRWERSAAERRSRRSIPRDHAGSSGVDRIDQSRLVTQAELVDPVTPSEILGNAEGGVLTRSHMNPSVVVSTTTTPRSRKASRKTSVEPVPVGEIDHAVSETQASAVDLATPSASLAVFRKKVLRKVVGNVVHDPADSQISDDDISPPDTVFQVTLDQIRGLWADRKTLVRQQVATTLRAHAYCRHLCHGDKDEAKKLFEAASKGKAHPLAHRASPIVMAMLISNSQPEAAQRQIEKELEKIVKKLPGFAFVKETKGLGLVTFAGIVGECGDLSAYRNPAKVWKRMGLGVLADGKRQRRIGGLSQEETLAIGYVPERRALVWVMGDRLIMAKGTMYDLYVARKEIEKVKTDAIAADPEQRKRFGSEEGGYAPGKHAHNRAKRYIEKRVLRDLWVAWRRERGQTTTDIQRGSVPLPPQLAA